MKTPAHPKGVPPNGSQTAPTEATSAPKRRGRPSKGDRTPVLLRLPSSLHQEFQALLHEADLSLSDVVGALVANLVRSQPSSAKLRKLAEGALAANVPERRRLPSSSR
jgi:hypothetical protein